MAKSSASSKRWPHSLSTGQPSFLRNFSRNSSSLLLVLVLAAEVGVGIFVIRDLLASEAQVQRMYDGSVLGLRRMGELQYQAQETRRSTLYALSTNDGNLQVRYADQSRAADREVTEGITQYLAQARTPGEIEIGTNLASDWNAYLRVRDEVLGLILESSAKDAVDLDLSAGVPLFDRVREDLEEAKRLYDRRATEHLASVSSSSKRSTMKLIGAFALTVVFGSITVWIIERGKLRNEVRFSKLQMSFVAAISHELRTPITAILSAGENVRDCILKDRARLMEQGLIITDQANQLMNLVDQVLLFAATGKNERFGNGLALPVSEIVEYSVRNTAGLLRVSGFTIDQDVQTGLPLVTGDLAAYCQCLQNLIVNAVKYSGKSRWIGISARVGMEFKEPEVCISVEDRGPGIDEGDLTRIFDPFYRSPQMVAAQIHGTGLGLTIAKRNAEAFGGRLTVASTVGVGSVFTLHLPASSGGDFRPVVATSTADRGIQQ